MAKIEQKEIESTKSFVESLAYHLVKNSPDAQDIAQDTYLAALQSDKPELSPTRGWLGRIAINNARMRFRSHTRRVAREQQQYWTPKSENAFSSLQQKQSARELLKALDALDDSTRGLIEMRYLHEMKIREIASEKKIPKGTVSWKISEGLKELKLLLDRAAGGDSRSVLLALCPLPALSPHPLPTTHKGESIMLKSIIALGAVATLGTAGFLAYGDKATPSKKDMALAAAPAKAQNVHSNTSQTTPPKPFEIKIRPSKRSSNRQVQAQKAKAGKLVNKGTDDAFVFAMFVEGDEDGAMESQIEQEFFPVKLFMEECHANYVEEHKGHLPKIDTIRLKVQLQKAEALGMFAVKTELMNENAVTLDRQFRECIEESSLGLAFKSNAFDQEELTVNMAMNFETKVSAQTDGVYRCLNQLENSPNVLSRAEIQIKMEECLGPVAKYANLSLIHI